MAAPKNGAIAKRTRHARPSREGYRRFNLTTRRCSQGAIGPES